MTRPRVKAQPVHRPDASPGRIGPSRPRVVCNARRGHHDSGQRPARLHLGGEPILCGRRRAPGGLEGRPSTDQRPVRPVVGRHPAAAYLPQAQASAAPAPGRMLRRHLPGDRGVPGHPSVSTVQRGGSDVDRVRSRLLKRVPRWRAHRGTRTGDVTPGCPWFAISPARGLAWREAVQITAGLGGPYRC